MFDITQLIVFFYTSFTSFKNLNLLTINNLYFQMIFLLSCYLFIITWIFSSMTIKIVYNSNNSLSSLKMEKFLVEGTSLVMGPTWREFELFGPVKSRYQMVQEKHNAISLLQHLFACIIWKTLTGNNIFQKRKVKY